MYMAHCAVIFAIAQLSCLTELKPNTHRRRDTTVELSRVSVVYWALVNRWGTETPLTAIGNNDKSVLNLLMLHAVWRRAILS